MMEMMNFRPQQHHMPHQAMLVPQPSAQPAPIAPPTPYTAAPLPDGTYPLSKRLVITQQTCLVEEKFSKNGIQKNVHVVVKNNPFLLTLALLDKNLNFHQLTTEVQLVYDCPSLKEVDFVKLKPLEWKTRPNEEGDQLTVELRIKVLTSQLEDMFFRVKVKVVDPRTRKEYPHLSALTHPIRVVSKPDQVRKKVKKRKRAPTDSLMDTLHRLESQQRDQQRMLKRLCLFTVNDANSSSSSSASAVSIKEEDTDSISSSSATAHGVSSSDTADASHDTSPASFEGSSSTTTVSLAPKDEFRQSFMDFLAAFKQLQSQDPSDGYKINTCANDAQTMAEVLDIVRSELKKMQPGNTSESDKHDSPCACKVCPYKERMDKINDSYKEYLYSAVLPDISTGPLALDSASGSTTAPTSSTSTPAPTTTQPPPPLSMATPSSSSTATTPSETSTASVASATGGLSMEMYGDADDVLLSGDADASLANFLNLNGINGFGFSGFGEFSFPLESIS